MLAMGPLARRAEDLLPLLNIMAGPDGLDPLVTPMELGRPGEVSLDGLTVTVVEDSSLRPISVTSAGDARRIVPAIGSGVAVYLLSVVDFRWSTAQTPLLR